MPRLKFFGWVVGLLAALALGGLPGAARAQSLEMPFHNLSVAQGLSHAEVLCAWQDKRGYLWFGTKKGLNRYDGYSFRTFTKKDGLSSENIQALYEDRRGYLWIGTYDGGLNRFDPATEQFKVFKNDAQNPTSISSDNIYAIAQDRSGDLWVGTFGSGLGRFSYATETFRTYRAQPNNPAALSNDMVSSIAVDAAGTLWVGTYLDGLCRFDPASERFETFRHQPGKANSLVSNDVYALTTDHHGNLWVGTYGGGLSCFNPRAGTFRNFVRQPGPNPSLSSNYVVAVREDALGAIWVATTKEGGGLNRLDPQSGQWQTYHYDKTSATSLASNDLNALCLDRAGTLWVGTGTSGVSQCRPQNLAFNTYLSGPQSFLGSSANAFCQDRDGCLWIGTFDNGLFRYDRRTNRCEPFYQASTNPGNLSGKSITALCEDDAGYLWVGTADEGLRRFDRRTRAVTTFTHRPGSLSSNEITALRKDWRGRLWIGTYGSGLDCYDPATQSFVHYENQPGQPNSLVGNNISVIFEDRAHTLWVGTKETGLSRFEPRTNTFTNYQNQPGDPTSLVSNAVSAISHDDLGDLWVGTDEGLCHLDPRTRRFQTLNVPQGLPGKVVCGIEKDRVGTLWVSTTRGLASVQPQSRRVHTYTTDDGLYNPDFADWAHYQNRQGEIFFGGASHFISFYPKRVAVPTTAPPVFLTDFKLFNQSVRLTKPLAETTTVDLKPNDDFFTIEFACLSFLPPDQNQYAYQLQGFDKDWNYVGSRRLAQYTNLDAGTYTFRVKAADRHGVWNEQGATLRIVVHPAWYRTLWFRTLVVMLIVGSAVSYYRRRLRSVEQQKAVLEDLVQVRTAELLLRNEEIEAQRDSIEATNMVLQSAKLTIEERNEELKTINNELEDRVAQRTQELQTAYTKVLESNQELDTFIYRASHDIRGPVARLVGLCKVALMDVHDPPALEYLRLLDQTGEETNRTLVRVLRIYEVRNATVEMAPFDLNACLQEVLDEFAPQYPDVRVEMTSAPGLAFASDQALVTTVFHSIVGNAFRFHRSRLAQPPFVRVEVLPGEDGQVSVRVTDNGSGIPEAQRGKLFSMFFKGTQDTSGGGLGLYVSRIAAEKIGGSIHHRTAQGETTVFEISLPNWTSTVDHVPLAFDAKAQ